MEDASKATKRKLRFIHHTSHLLLCYHTTHTPILHVQGKFEVIKEACRVKSKEVPPRLPQDLSAWSALSHTYTCTCVHSYPHTHLLRINNSASSHLILSSHLLFCAQGLGHDLACNDECTESSSGHQRRPGRSAGYPLSKLVAAASMRVTRFCFGCFFC